MPALQGLAVTAFLPRSGALAVAAGLLFVAPASAQTTGGAPIGAPIAAPGAGETSPSAGSPSDGAPPVYRLPPGASIPFPNFAVDAECARKGGPPSDGPSAEADFRACREQEIVAHGRLRASWGRVPAGVVLSCMALARGTGFGSYAVLATCIEPRFSLR